jgi:hypothetical protein
LVSWFVPGERCRYAASKKHMDEKLLFDPAKTEGGPPRGQLVYHYTSCFVANTFILSGKKQLLANALFKMNDPMEHVPKFLLGGSSVGLEHNEIIRITKAFNTASLENARLLCCSLDTPAEIVPHPMGPAVRRPGRRGFDHPSMWAHYANNHNGVCLIFYRNALDQAVRQSAKELNVRSGSVTYGPWAANAVIQNKSRAGPAQKNASEIELIQWAASEIQKNHKALYFVKHDDWAPESEYRWLILGPYEGDLYVRLTGNELAGVVVGSDFPLSQHANIRAICEEWDVPVRAMMWTNGESNHPWPLSNESDPDDINDFWRNRELEAARRRKQR